MSNRFIERSFRIGGKHSLSTPKMPRTGRRSREKNAILQPNEFRNDERGRRVYGKTFGGAIGAMVSISTQLVISYSSGGNSKRITLDAYNSGCLVTKIEKDFRQSHHFKSSTMEL